MNPREIVIAIATHLISSLTREMEMLAVYSRTQPDAWQVILLTRRYHSTASYVVSVYLDSVTQVLAWARQNLPESDFGPMRMDIEIWEQEAHWHRHAPGTLLADSPFVLNPKLLIEMPSVLPDGWVRLVAPPRTR